MKNEEQRVGNTVHDLELVYERAHRVWGCFGWCGRQSTGVGGRIEVVVYGIDIFLPSLRQRRQNWQKYK